MKQTLKADMPPFPIPSGLADLTIKHIHVFPADLQHAPAKWMTHASMFLHADQVSASMPLPGSVSLLQVNWPPLPQLHHLFPHASYLIFLLPS